MSSPLEHTQHLNLLPRGATPAPMEPLAKYRVGPVERRRPLSKSLVWSLERRFYEEQGKDAWIKGGIPHYVTSNPIIGGAYAKVVFGFLRDCHSLGKGPLRIVELGAGHGRFAHCFLTRFIKLHERSALARIPFRYIMTDLAERNIDHWRSHPKLRRFIDDGILDFARFDVGTDREIRLRCSGEVIMVDDPCANLAVIANYVFDSVPQDAFHVKDGRLYETLITLTLSDAHPNLDSPGALAGAAASYDHGPARDDYYEDADWNGILASYRDRLADCSFQFPTAALTCIKDLRRLTTGGFLLLSGDKGYSDERALLAGSGAPSFAPHHAGCFSVMVNYHAIGEYFAKHGGRVLHPGHGFESVTISAFAASDPPTPFVETTQAYAESVDELGPDDLFNLMMALEEQYVCLPLPQILSWIRMTGHDSRVFLRCAPGLEHQCAQASEQQRRDLAAMLDEVWEASFPLVEDFDLALQIGALFYAMQLFTRAITYFQWSIDDARATPGALHNIGLCHYHLNQIEAALGSFLGALEIDPDYEPARRMRIIAEASIG